MERQQFAQGIADLQKKADVLYPGCKIIIQRADSVLPALPVDRWSVGGFNTAPQSTEEQRDFSKMTYGEQIADILVKHEEPVTKEELLNEMHMSGSDISNETLLSLLSKNAKGEFLRIRRGIWTHSMHGGE